MHSSGTTPHALHVYTVRQLWRLFAFKQAYRGLCVIASVVATSPVLPQATGILDAEARADAEIRSLEVRRQIEQRARLFVDPSFTSPTRSSAWAFALRTLSRDGEVAVQLNLSNWIGGDSSAVALGLISPINKNNAITELADLDGLVGTTRGELAWTRDLAKATHTNLYARIAGSAPKFAYRLATDPTPIEKRKPNFSGGGGLTIRDKGETTLLRLGVDYEKSHAGQKAQSICVPANIGVPNAVTCSSVVIGEPKRVTKHVARMEFRHTLRKWFAGSIGLNHDFKNDVTGIDLPLWVVPDVKKKAGGGLRVGYRSDTKEWTLALFVSQFQL